MPLRLYMDQDSMRAAVVRGLREAGVETLTSAEAGNSRLSDERQLEFATASSRTMYSANQRDFARLHAAWVRAGRTHAGIILRSRQRISVADELQALRNICESREPGAATSVIFYLENWL